MYSLTLYRIDQARNMQHFYHLNIQSDLFGNHCLKSMHRADLD